MLHVLVVSHKSTQVPPDGDVLSIFVLMYKVAQKSLGIRCWKKKQKDDTYESFTRQ
jgi:hypothetical protein